ncbi:hypothetical protein D7X55_29690 [Corallococcus sp. AB049A]|uniref:Uncharacterized protein n=1 Tax=Corallococcus interemptor TaxID=2316720 RepID=A0A3A8QYG0_9BACT|nr:MULTISPECIES: hypothetical protein [Corallococcus]RKH68174.1 hypothetical protein D7X96_17945 [Corallococcus interemptor]RKI55110.1 hypothetical protein D7X55_29690 [Corallococcus sp. AB049A]
MNKKWILGLGLGAAGLLVVGGGLVATGFWADRQMDGSGMDTLMQTQERARKTAELNARYPFQPPAQGRVMKLDEARLEAYLAAREATFPAYRVLEKESLEFVQANGQALGSGDRRARLRAANASLRMMGKAQAALLQNLEAQRMSPQEFRRITAVVYPPPPRATPDAGVAMVSSPSDPANLAQLEAQLAAITPRLEDPKLSEAERLQLEQRRAGLRKFITQLELASGKDVKDANAALLKKHAERIAKVANPTFDDLLARPLEAAGGTAGLPMP